MRAVCVDVCGRGQVAVNVPSRISAQVQAKCLSLGRRILKSQRRSRKMWRRCRLSTTSITSKSCWARKYFNTDNDWVAVLFCQFVFLTLKFSSALRKGFAIDGLWFVQGVVRFFLNHHIVSLDMNSLAFLYISSSFW